MKIILKINLLLLFLCLFFITNAQSNDYDPFAEPGKCYAKCILGKQLDYWEEAYPVYLGIYEDNLDFLEKTGSL